MTTIVEPPKAGYSHLLTKGTEIEKYSKKIISKIYDLDIEFDSIVCRGISGALVAGILAAEFKRDIIVIRKNITDTFSDYLVEYSLSSPLEYIIVDDFVSTGKTINDIVAKMGEFFPCAEPVFGVLYCQNYDLDMELWNMAECHLEILREIPWLTLAD